MEITTPVWAEHRIDLLCEREERVDVTVRVPERTRCALRARAFETGSSINALVYASVRRHLDTGGTLQPVMQRSVAGARRLHCLLPRGLYETLRRTAIRHGSSANQLICAWLAADYHTTMGMEGTRHAGLGV